MKVCVKYFYSFCHHNPLYSNKLQTHFLSMTYKKSKKINKLYNDFSPLDGRSDEGQKLLSPARRVFPPAEAFLGPSCLGAGLLLSQQWQRHRRGHQGLYRAAITR